MKVRAYVLFVAVALLAVSAGTKNAKPTVGINPGDFAPRIESLGTCLLYTSTDVKGWNPLP